MSHQQFGVIEPHLGKVERGLDLLKLSRRGGQSLVGRLEIAPARCQQALEAGRRRPEQRTAHRGWELCDE